MNNHCYYIAVGDNGGVVASNYERALLYKTCLRGHKYVKKFSDFEEAEDYVLDHIAEKAPFGCPIPMHCKINEIIFISKLMRDY